MPIGIYEKDDVDAVANAIRNNLGNDTKYTVGQMPTAINEIQTYAYNSGHSEGYGEGRDDGYSMGREDGITEGKAEGLEEGKAIGYEEGKTDGLAEGIEQGKKSQYDEFWEEILDGSSFIAKFAGRGWNNNTFKPNKSFTVSSNANFIFYNNGYTGGLTELSNSLGIEIIIQPSTLLNAFCFSSINECKIDGIYLTSLDYAFIDSELVTLELIGLLPKCSFGKAFERCSKLENLTTTGTIGQNGLNLQWSTRLSKASWVSVVGCYSTTISGLSMTGSLDSVNSAFETSEGANDGSTSAEWLNLIATRPNVSFNLL